MSGTPHNNARAEDIAKTVLMQGDPIRTKFIAENYLDNVKQFTSVRNIYGYTGTYKGHRLSVMAHGMGMPSLGIYTYELYNFLGVENIIRTGSAGGLIPEVKLMDIVIAQGASHDSSYDKQYRLQGTFAPLATFDLLYKAYETSKELDISVKVGNIISTDVFYNDNPNYNKEWADMGVLAVEMEAAALYMNAARADKNALTMCTVSDNLATGERLSVEEREVGFDKMIRLGLETAIKL